MLNRCDFRCVLKVENVPDRRRSTGRLFQARGPATARARSPVVERHIAGTRTSAVDAERSRRRKSTSDSGWINSDRYCGAAPFRQLCTRTQVCTGCIQAHAPSTIEYVSGFAVAANMKATCSCCDVLIWCATLALLICSVH